MKEIGAGTCPSGKVEAVKTCPQPSLLFKSAIHWNFASGVKLPVRSLLCTSSDFFTGNGTGYPFSATNLSL